MDLFNLVQAQNMKLSGSGVNATITSLKLTSMKTPDGTAITMSDFGTTGYGTLEPGTSKEEQITFVGITQNADGTATVTGVTRGVQFVAPYAEDSNLKQAHSGGTIFVLSNTPAMYDNFLSTNQDKTVTETLTFTTPNFPEMNDNTAPTVDTQLATKKYVDDTAIAGSPDMSVTIKGIAEEATLAEVDAGTGAGDTGARLAVNPESLAASIYGLQLPGSDEKDALSGTSGTPSSSNEYVTNDDTDNAATADKVSRYDSNGDMIVPTTPTDEDAAASKAYVDESVPVFEITPADEIYTQANTIQNTTSTSYVKVKEIEILMAGTYTTHLEIRGSGSNKVYGRIYKDGAALGTEHSTEEGNYQEYEQNLTFSVGDLVQLYIKVDVTSTVYAQNFQLRASLQIANTIITD